MSKIVGCCMETTGGTFHSFEPAKFADSSKKSAQSLGQTHHDLVVFDADDNQYCGLRLRAICNALDIVVPTDKNEEVMDYAFSLFGLIRHKISALQNNSET